MLPKVICIWVTVYLISENQSKIAFFFFFSSLPNLNTDVPILNQGTGAQNARRVLCLPQHHCCFIHMLVQISRRRGWKRPCVESNPPPPHPALIAMVPLSKVQWLFYSPILTFNFSSPNAVVFVVVSSWMEQSVHLNLRSLSFKREK